MKCYFWFGSLHIQKLFWIFDYFGNYLLLPMYVCDNTTLPIMQSPHALPPMNNIHYATLIKMRPSTVVISIGTLRYLNQNEQHYTTLSIILLLETLPKLQWSQVLEQRTQSEKWPPWCYTHYNRH